jgi:AraC-like DNA-binding protein
MSTPRASEFVYAAPITAQVERHVGGLSFFRTARGAHPAAELRLVQPRHVVTLGLSGGPVVSADEFAGRRLPRRRRVIRNRVNLIAAGDAWISDTEAQRPCEYVAVFLPAEGTAPPVLRDGGALDLERPALRAVMTVIAHELAHNDPSPLCLEAAAALVHADLARREGAAASPPPAAALSPQRLARVEAIIRARLADPPRLQELAQAAGLSPAQFWRAYKAATGCTPHRFAQEVRLQEAQSLLLRPGLSLAEVAAATGFADQAHFTTVFRRARGLTPGAFRRAARD